MEKVQMFRAKDGSFHATADECISYEAKLAGLTFRCPKCEGKWTVNGEPITKYVEDLESTAYMGYFAPMQYKDVIVGYEQVCCPVCYGFGWTKEPKKAITKQVVVGYK